MTVLNSELPKKSSITIIETMVFDAKEDNIRYTQDGYLAVMPRVARTGIQQYRGKEVGRPDLDIVNIWRPEEQVFDADSLRSFAHKPITNDHPTVPVDAKNWRDHTVGMTDGEIVRDGEYVRVPMLIMDGGTINAIKDGKKQLSVGYGAELVWGKGQTPTGEFYDAMQSEIRVNHIATVKAARGGSKLSIGDGPVKELPQQRRERMSTRIVDVDGVKIEMEDTEGSIVQRHMQRLNDEVSRQKVIIDLFEKKKVEEEEEDKKKKQKQDAADAKITVLEQQLKDAVAASEITPAKLDALVRDRAVVVTKAKAVLADKLVIDGKSNEDIQRQVVDAKLGDAAKGWNGDKVTAAFDALTNDVKTNAADAVANDFSRPGYVGSNVKTTHYDNYDKSLGERWKNKDAA